MTLYDEMQQVAREILSDSDFKQGAIRLISLTPGTGPIDEPGPATEVPHVLDGTARGVKFKYVAMSLAVASDLQVTFSVKPDVPAPKMLDFIEIDGVRHKITRILPKPAAGVPVAYTVIVER